MFDKLIKKLHISRISNEIVMMWFVILVLIAILLPLIDFNSGEEDFQRNIQTQIQKSDIASLSPDLFDVGTGSTTVAPLYEKMSDLFFHEMSKKDRKNYSYKPLNSDTGLNLLEKHKVGYVSLDRPLTHYERLSLDAFQFPTLVYGVAIVVNIPGVENNQLRLSRKNLADIFLGNITRWDDPKLLDDNPDLTLPDMEIVVMHPNSNADINFTLSNYLSVISQDWLEKCGRGTEINWPVGIGEPDDPDIGKKMENTLGGIGFFESGFISKFKVSTVLLENASGHYVGPSRESIAASVPFFDENVFYDYSEIQARLPGPECYPLVGMNYTVILLMRSPSFEQTAQIAEFWEIVSWMFDHGETAEEMGTQVVFLPQRFLKKIYDTYASESKAFQLRTDTP